MKGPCRLLHLKNADSSSNLHCLPRLAIETPSGISAHWDVILDNLLACYEDIIDLDAAVADGLHPSHSSDDVQASIESPLANLAELCKYFNMAAECARLAAYICSYTAYVEIWKNFLAHVGVRHYY